MTRAGGTYTIGAPSLFSGGSLVRSTETISAPYLSVGDATFDLLGNDSFAPTEATTISGSALVNAPAGTSLGCLNVYGINGNGDRAGFNVDGDLSLSSASVFLMASSISSPERPPPHCSPSAAPVRRARAGLISGAATAPAACHR